MEPFLLPFKYLLVTYRTNKYSAPCRSELLEHLHPLLMGHGAVQAEHIQVYRHQPTFSWLFIFHLEVIFIF